MDLFSALGNFVRVADTGSFSRVARETSQSHSAITRQIAALEQHLKVRLLHRTTRKVSLTGDGEILIGHARRMLEASSAMEQEFGAHRDEPAGLVRVGCIMGAGMFLAARLPQLLQPHPALSVELVVCDHLSEMVESRLDLTLCDGDLAGRSFIARQIGIFDYCVVAAPLYLSRHGVPKAPEDLERHTCILRGAQDRRGTWEFGGPTGPIQVVVSGQLLTNNERAALEMALSGYGIACLPDAQVGDDVHAGRLVRLLPQYEPKPAMLYAVYPSRRQLATRTRAVLSFLIQQGRTKQDAADWQLPMPGSPDDRVAVAQLPLTALGDTRAAAMN